MRGRVDLLTIVSMLLMHIISDYWEKVKIKIGVDVGGLGSGMARLGIGRGKMGVKSGWFFAFFSSFLDFLSFFSTFLWAKLAGG